MRAVLIAPASAAAAVAASASDRRAERRLPRPARSVGSDAAGRARGGGNAALPRARAAPPPGRPRAPTADLRCRAAAAGRPGLVQASSSAAAARELTSASCEMDASAAGQKQLSC